MAKKLTKKAPRMERLAQKVADETGLVCWWEDDLVSSEIGTAEDEDEAIGRLETIIKDCERAIEAVDRLRWPRRRKHATSR